jgi:tight adherence protein B
VAEQSGAGLGSAVARLAETQRSTQRARELLTAELAAVRTSARLLGVLPLLGLALGHWLGTDPWGWLTGSAPGLVVLLAGGSLQLAGLFWLRRIVASVEGSL